MAEARKLYDVRHEICAAMTVEGKTPDEIAKHLGVGTSTVYKWLSEERLQARIDTLMERAAHRAELSRAAILDRMMEDWEQARRMGQMASALKAGELLGRELHKMFTERKEIGGPGDFDNKSEQELRDYILNEMKALGIKPSDLPAVQHGLTELPPKEEVIEASYEEVKPTNGGSSSVN